MSDWDDDRPGMMRVHVAARRAELLRGRLVYNEMRRTSRAKGVTVYGDLKADHAWALAVGGFVDEHGNLRAGWPARDASPADPV